MDILIGLGLLVWSCGLFVFKQFFSDGLTSQAMIQIAVATVGALVILGPKVFNLLINFEIPDKEEEKDEFTYIYFRVYYFYSVRLFLVDDCFKTTPNPTK